MVKAFPSLKALDGQRLSLPHMDMGDLGIEDQVDDGKDFSYDLQGEKFYPDEIHDGKNINLATLKMAAPVVKECVEFDRILAECNSFLQRKTTIM